VPPPEGLRFELVTLDTDILVSLLKGASDAVDKIRLLQENGDRISTTMINAYELLKGAYISSSAEENLVRVSEVISNLRILELSLGAAEEAGRIYQELSDKGKLVGEFDILIAGIVKFHDEALVTRDSHFKSIRGMRIINW
jgi:predicted nucleic acid-binding protein